MFVYCLVPDHNGNKRCSSDVLSQFFKYRCNKDLPNLKDIFDKIERSNFQAKTYSGFGNIRTSHYWKLHNYSTETHAVADQRE